MSSGVRRSGPEDCSIEDQAGVGTEPWTGVRNCQGGTFMRDGVRVDDGVRFYHSNADVPGIYGIARVASTA